MSSSPSIVFIQSASHTKATVDRLPRVSETLYRQALARIAVDQRPVSCAEGVATLNKSFSLVPCGGEPSVAEKPSTFKVLIARFNSATSAAAFYKALAQTIERAEEGPHVKAGAILQDSTGTRQLGYQPNAG
jgi:hypothetical protein